ncbi:MAG: CRISPR-associated protein Csx16 [Thiomicrorhabdus sp.]|nr:CRISPR-associated protein Csx16 [Thiomicrorhabdus sp.]
MTVYLVSRHKASVAWLRARGIAADVLLPHFNEALLSKLQPEDVVAGNLPIQMVAQLTQKGVRYYHLLIPVTLDLRGKELSLMQLNALDVQLVEFKAERLSNIV